MEGSVFFFLGSLSVEDLFMIYGSARRGAWLDEGNASFVDFYFGGGAKSAEKNSDVLYSRSLIDRQRFFFQESSMHRLHLLIRM
jgi:hypothetical protein